jgi:hypothetical protein
MPFYMPGMMTGTPEALARMIIDRESRSGGGGGISDYLGIGGTAGGAGLGALLGSAIPIPGLGTLAAWPNKGCRAPLARSRLWVRPREGRSNNRPHNPGRRSSKHATCSPRHGPNLTP